MCVCVFPNTSCPSQDFNRFVSSPVIDLSTKLQVSWEQDLLYCFLLQSPEQCLAHRKPSENMFQNDLPKAMGSNKCRSRRFPRSPASRSGAENPRVIVTPHGLLVLPPSGEVKTQPTASWDEGQESLSWSYSPRTLLPSPLRASMVLPVISREGALCAGRAGDALGKAGRAQRRGLGGGGNQAGRGRSCRLETAATEDPEPASRAGESSGE